MSRPTSPVDPVEEIRRLYYAATEGTIERDLRRAIALLKTLATEEDRERAAVFMDGLSQMRSEWAARRRGASQTPGARPTRKAPPSRSRR